MQNKKLTTPLNLINLAEHFIKIMQTMHLEEANYFNEWKEKLVAIIERGVGKLEAMKFSKKFHAKE
jgi:hypothetical protein